MIQRIYIASLTCCSIGIFLNGIGLFILFNLKNSEIDLTQRYILTNLCFIDFCYSIFFEIYIMLNVLNVSEKLYQLILTMCIKTAMNGYYLATFWLIIDRYLHIKLNIRYVIYWSKKRTIIAAIFLWMLMALTGSLFAVYDYYLYVIYAAFDSIILLFSSYVYIYALILFKKQRVTVCSNQNAKGIFKGLGISAIILVAFAVLVAIPDTIIAVASVYRNTNYNEKIIWYKLIVHPLSFWTDSIIYIFLSPKVRLVLKNKLKCVPGNRSVTTGTSELNFIKSYLNKQVMKITQ